MAAKEKRGKEEREGERERVRWFVVAIKIAKKERCKRRDWSLA